MGNKFEDYFMNIQTDMIGICLEYVDERADLIFIYGSYEENVVTGDCFYVINNKVLKKDELNKSNNGKYDTSESRQEQVLDILNKDIEKIGDLCEKYKQKIPTEIKIIYNVNKKTIQTKFQYDLIYSNTEDKFADDIFNEWFESIKEKLDTKEEKFSFIRNIFRKNKK